MHTTMPIVKNENAVTPLARRRSVPFGSINTGKGLVNTQTRNTHIQQIYIPPRPPPFSAPTGADSEGICAYDDANFEDENEDAVTPLVRRRSFTFGSTNTGDDIDTDSWVWVCNGDALTDIVSGV